jgi:RND family efflux transporter MFP subunit
MKLIRIIIAVSIIVAGILVFKYLVTHKVKTEKKHVQISSPIVQVIKIRKIKQSIPINATGIVKPVHVTLIQPEVSGKIVYISKKFLNGKIVNKNEILIKIEDTDYKVALSKAKASYYQALLNLEKVKEESKRAVEEWKSSKEKFGFKQATSLRFFKPQLKAAKAQVNSAKAQIKITKKNLERTALKAPFKGIIVNKKDVDIGTFASKGTVLAKLIGIDLVEAVTPVADYDYSFIDFKNKDVIVSLKLRENIYQFRGEIDRSEKIINNSTRMINIYTVIKNPYKQLSDKMPLLIGSFVEVTLNGKQFDNIAEIPVIAIHGENEIWIARNNELIRKKIKILKTNRNSAFISGDFYNNELLITTNLPYVSTGMKIKLFESK